MLRNFKILLLGFIFLVSCDDESGIRGNGLHAERTFADVNSANFFIDIPANVYYSRSDKNSIRIEGDANLIDLIEITENGTEMTIQCIEKSSFTELKIYISSPELDLIEINSPGNIANLNSFSDPDVNFRINGVGNIQLRNVNINNLHLAIEGNGNIRAEGSSMSTLAEIRRNGNIELEDLRANSVKAVIQGNGNISAWAINELFARILGSGNINIYGDPQSIDTKIGGSGNINYE